MSLPFAYSPSFPINPQGTPEVAIGDGAHVGAFQRLRVANPTTLFDSTAQFSDGTELKWYHKLVTNGTTTHLPNESAVQMSVTTEDGSRVVRQSREYIQYQPGKSTLALISFVFGTPQANTVKRVGLFDDRNGIFLQADNTDVAMVIRSYTSGSAVDTVIPQASWNLDAMDGNGPSGITLDLTKAQIFTVDAQWLGVGRVRVGFDIGGTIIYVHEVLNANVVSTTYMTTLSLPIRYEIVNTDVAAGAASMKAICASVVSEGGAEAAQSIVHTLSTITTARTATTSWLPAIAIRPPEFFSGTIPWRLPITVESIEILNTGSVLVAWNLFWIDGLGTSTVDGGTWSQGNSASRIDSNLTATGFTFNDTLRADIVSGHIAAGQGISVSQPQRTSLRSQFPTTRDIDGANPSVLALGLITASSTADCYCSVSFRVG